MSALPLPIRYKPFLGITMVVMALFILGVAFLTGRLFPQAITGTILLLVSLGYLTRPAIVVSESAIELKNMLGMTMKSHAFASLADVTLDDGGLAVNGTRVKIARWMLSGEDLAQLASVIAATQSTKPTLSAG